MATNNIARVTEMSTVVARAGETYLASTKDALEKLTALEADSDSAAAATAAKTALNTKRAAVSG